MKKIKFKKKYIKSINNIKQLKHKTLADLDIDRLQDEVKLDKVNIW